MAEDTPITLKELTDALDVSEQTIRRWVKEKGFPYHKPGGKRLYFYWDEVNEWIRSHNESDDSGSGEGNSAEATDGIHA